MFLYLLRTKTKAMSTDNQQQQNDKDFPGYPHYPAGEDITRPGNSGGRAYNSEPQPDPADNNTTDGETNIVMGTDADVTEDDRRLLDQSEQGMADGDEAALINSALDNEDDDGDKLNEDGFEDDMTGGDLDIPGAEDDNADENIGEEDEENNYYSLGGDRNDD